MPWCFFQPIPPIFKNFSCKLNKSLGRYSSLILLLLLSRHMIIIPKLNISDFFVIRPLFMYSGAM
uniref:Uncharacterized protein n=1 Tax=Arundo donax TaxID=35708 RepID=A0A0A9AKB8_ARUDO